MLRAVAPQIGGAVDYEAGAWTPSLEGQTTAGVQTYNGADGFYRKIGDMVFAFYQINLNALGTAGDAPAGNAIVAGLPYAARDNTPTDYMTFPGLVSDVSLVNYDGAGGYTTVRGRVFQGTSAIRLRQSGDNLGANNIPITAFSAGSALLIGAAVYLTD